MSIKQRKTRTWELYFVTSPLNCWWFVYEVDTSPIFHRPLSPPNHVFQCLMTVFVLWFCSHIRTAIALTTLIRSYQWWSHSLAGLKDVEYRLAQSGDATCSGLENSDYGSRIMTLKRFGPAERCDFPKWFKEPKHWHSLNGELSYNVHQKYVFCFVVSSLWPLPW